MAFLPGSPAIGNGTSVPGITTDQRGLARSGSGIDIGAFQSQPSLEVNTTDDAAVGAEASGDLSLRDAITLANVLGGGTVTFDSSLSDDTITLSGSELPEINAGVQVTITGLGANQLAVSGNGMSRVFDIASGATVSISGLTIENGYVAHLYGHDGGAIYNAGTLTMTDSTVTGSTAYSGGGIYNSFFGTLTIYGSTISNNVDHQLGHGGGISNAGVLSVTDSTVAGNSSSFYGGGIFNSNTLTVVDSTVSGNSAPTGGGIFNNGTFSLDNSIVAGNTATNSNPDIDGSIANDLGYNLLGTALQGTTFGPGDVFSDCADAHPAAIQRRPNRDDGPAAAWQPRPGNRRSRSGRNYCPERRQPA